MYCLAGGAAVGIGVFLLVLGISRILGRPLVATFRLKGGADHVPGGGGSGGGWFDGFP